MHNYISKLLRLYRENPEALTPGTGLGSVEIQHDDWCALLAGVGECNCDPNLKVEEREWPDE